MISKMWITTKDTLAMQKDLTFNELYTECRLAAPGAKLSYSIRNRLERFSRDERKEIVSRVKEGCAPLFVACKKGNVEIVEYLIEHCDADVEQRGMYEVPDDRSIHFVTPLWCASVAGKLSVVRCLVEHGANVNSVSDTGSTPVRSACFMTHYEIVTYLVENNADILKPNYNGGTCLINSVQSVPLCEFLIKHGADVNAQDIQFKTALHYAIQEHRFETTKLLLENRADPFIKSRYGDDALETACLKCATHVFEYLCENYNYSKQRVAEAHELIGSTFLEEHQNLRKCLHHWRLALSIRYSDPNNVIPKNFVSKAPYGYIAEFNTYEELENISMDLDAMRIQSLLVCERILGPLHRDMIFRLMFRGAAYADSLQYQRCINLWRYALELRIQKDSLLHSEVCFAAQALVKLFLDFHEKHQTGMLREQIEFNDVYESIRMLVCRFESSNYLLNIRPVFKRQQDNFDKILKVLTHQIFVLHVIPKTPEQIMMMKQLIRDILRIEPRTSAGDTLLHLVVSKSNTMKPNNYFEDPHTAIFPNAAIAELLLECGANVEVINYNLSTPLHIAALISNFTPEVIQVLLKYGAHIDRRNGNGNHPHYMLQSISECNVNHLQYTTLKCLAARKVIEKQISFIGEVPVHLEEFIRIH